MQNIIEKISREAILKELTHEKFIRKSNNGSNDIYILTAHNSPNIMQEIGRLRELTFRSAGGGTGKSADIDDFDTAPKPYRQLIVWNAESESILGGYRFMLCNNESNTNDLSTSEILVYSDTFKKNYLPYMIELGRSFVVPEHQTTGSSRRDIFTLDNLWDGLGALIVDNPHVKYFFGKVTMYTDYPLKARDLLLYFMEKHFGDSEKLLYPRKTVEIQAPLTELAAVLNQKDYNEDYKILSKEIRNMGEKIPPLINAYMNLSPTMKVFGTSVNEHFGGVIETGIMVTIPDIYPVKTERHVATYSPIKRTN